MFNSIGVFGKYNGFHSWKGIDKLIGFFQERERVVYLDQTSCADFPIERYGVELLSREQMHGKIDVAIVVGGDGTFLDVARYVVDQQIPILGVNLGRLGFLADVSPDTMLSTMDDLLNGTFDCEERNLLHVEIYEHDQLVFKHLAFNDVVIHKPDAPKMIEFETFINQRFLKSQRSDGMIISTPTGSTAYALSAGGPIVHPSLNVITLVSINPHSMSNRPFVIDGDSEIELRAHENCNGIARITCDGQITFEINAKHRTHVKRHPHFIKLIHPCGHDYFQLLRAKLHWGEKL
ncbi:NAD(+) kinase [Thiomicrospira microaerophila]|uniref:NAD(+) kinase n=1 Tax=Thiomicrospira microaerophila TaxID=406020 RepID=UPI0005C99FEF|nr:NAD(+) kinase [Thiomicrospira microaerophila]